MTKSIEKIIDIFAVDLERIFRYILPGAIFLAYGFLFDKELVPGLTCLEENKLYLLVAVIIFGAVIYVFQRYVVATFIDYALFIFKSNSFYPDNSNVLERFSIRLYGKCLGEHLQKRFDKSIMLEKDLSGHLLLRHSHLHSLFLIFELVFIYLLRHYSYSWWKQLIIVLIILFFIVLPTVSLERAERKILQDK